MKISSLFFCLIISVNAIAQKNCAYKIDTAKILSNENLNSFLSAIQADSFKISYNKKDIPSFIRKQLDCVTGDFSLANPKEKYQATDVIIKKLPERQLQFIAISKDIFVMTYRKGGFANTAHILFIRFQDNEIIDLWTGLGGDDLRSLQIIIDYIQFCKDKKLDLNTNRIYL